MWKFLRGGATFIPGATSIPDSRVAGSEASEFGYESLFYKYKKWKWNNKRPTTHVSASFVLSFHCLSEENMITNDTMLCGLEWNEGYNRLLGLEYIVKNHP